MKKKIISILLSLALVFCTLFGTTGLPAKAAGWNGYSSGGFHGGSGTNIDPYQIATPQELAHLADWVNAGSDTSRSLYYVLTADIDLSGNQWTPIGTSTTFIGNFNGRGHTVTGLTIGSENSPYTSGTVNAAGLFGQCGGTISDVGIENAAIYTGDGLCLSVGGLVGALCSSGSISDSYVYHSTISSTRQSAALGGLVGSSNNGYIYNSYTNATVIGGLSASVGGLLGNTQSGTVENCYAAGTVSDSSTGAYVGAVIGNINYCSTTNFQKAYWNSDASQVNDIGAQSPALGIGHIGTVGLTDPTINMTAGIMKNIAPLTTLADTLNVDPLTKGGNNWIYISGANDGFPVLTDIGAGRLPQLNTPFGLAWSSTTPGTATWTAVANASGYRVQLYKNGFPLSNSIVFAETNAYNFSYNIRLNGSGTYTFIVTALGDNTNSKDSPPSAMSGPYDVTVSGAPMILSKPNDTAARVGGTANFSVSANNSDGGTLTYQWQKLSNGPGWPDWVDISGATNSSYTTGALAPGDNGNQYRVVVTNTKDSALPYSLNSNSARLTVYSGFPVIVTQPVSVTVAAGATASFSVTATSPDNATLTYQWKKSTDGQNWSAISGATDSTYVTGALAIGDSGTKYRVTVTNTNGSAQIQQLDSDSASVTVKAAPKAPTAIGGKKTIIVKDVTEGATPKLYKADGTIVIATPTKNADGTYTYTDLEPGDYDVTQILNGTESGHSSTVTVTGDTSQAPKAPTATGEKKTITVKDVIEGATPKLYKADGTIVIATPTKNADGTYTYTGLDVGGYYVTQTVGGTESGHSSTVTVTGDTPQAPKAPTAAGGKNTITVKDVTEGATPKLYKADGTIVIATPTKNADGTYTYTGLDAGGYYVTQTVGGTESGHSSTVTVTALPSDALPTSVIKKIDSLPDPATATDQQIIDRGQDIKKAKILYDSLDGNGRNTVGPVRQDKLNRLIYRLNALLIIIPKDQNTGITANNLGTSVLLPELSDPDVGKVTVKLVVNPVSNTINPPANIVTAAAAIAQTQRNILAAYDISLFKSVFDGAGKQLSNGKISNNNIVGSVTIQIPVPAGYAGRTDLKVVYIDDAGNVTQLPTTVVTVDGIQYLQFATTHFSEYAITIPAEVSAVSNPKTGDESTALPLDFVFPLGISALAFLGGNVLNARRKRRKNETFLK